MSKEICPRCGKEGSGLHEKWVLNEQKVRYEPYYSFAHSKDGKVVWCYIAKRLAIEIIHSKALQKKYNMDKPIASKIKKQKKRRKRG